MTNTRQISVDAGEIKQNLNYMEKDELINAYDRVISWLADVEYHLNKQKKEALMQLLAKDPTISPNQQKVLVDGRCAYDIKVMTLLTGLRKSIEIRLKTV